MIVNPPTFVVVASIGAIAPPRVLMWLFVEVTKTINKTTLHKLIQPLALYRKKARYIGISYGVVNVYRLVTDVIVATSLVFCA